MFEKSEIDLISWRVVLEFYQVL